MLKPFYQALRSLCLFEFLINFIRKSKVLVPVVGHDMYDGHQAGHPADHQHHHAVGVGQVLHRPGELGEVEHQVEALGHVSHGVSEADGDVEEDHLEDDES